MFCVVAGGGGGGVSETGDKLGHMTMVGSTRVGPFPIPRQHQQQHAKGWVRNGRSDLFPGRSYDRGYCSKVAG